MAAGISSVSTSPSYLDGDIFKKLPSLTEKIVEIFEKYAEEKDSLSDQIFKWGDQFLNTLELTDSPDLALQDGINQLKGILVNPLNSQLLIDPVVVYNPSNELHEIWEKWLLEESLAVFGETFTIQEGLSLSVHRPHLFAKELLEWIQLCNDDSTLATTCIGSSIDQFKELPNEKKAPVLIFLRRLAKLKQEELNSIRRTHELEKFTHGKIIHKELSIVESRIEKAKETAEKTAETTAIAMDELSTKREEIKRKIESSHGTSLSLLSRMIEKEHGCTISSVKAKALEEEVKNLTDSLTQAAERFKNTKKKRFRIF
jgi:hypothetical protein